jgi:gliding motility-associated-like protein
MEFGITTKLVKKQDNSWFWYKASKTFSISLQILLLLFAGGAFAQTAFTASWPLTTDLTASKTGNVTVNNATYTAGTGGLFTGAVAYGPSLVTGVTGFSGTGISGRGSATCDITHNSVTALCSSTNGSITPFMEFVLSPLVGNVMNVNSLTFAVSAPNVTTSGRVIAAGYSVDGGTTFTGFTPTATAGATANASPLSSTFSVSSATTFTYSLPAAVTVGNGSSLRIRILIWRNNGGGTAACSGSSGSTFTIGALAVAGNTLASSSPIAPSLSNFVVSSPKVSNDPDFVLTDPTSNSLGAFTYTSSDVNIATISGKTISLKAPGTTTITATQTADGAYSSGSTTANLIVLAAPETPTAQAVPYTQDFGNIAFVDLPAGLVAWQTSVNYTSRGDAEVSVPYTKANITTRSTALVTTLTPSGVIYGYAVPDPITTIANASLGFLIKSANSPQLSMALNTTGKANINLKYDINIEKIGTIDAIAAQYRIGSGGAWITLDGSSPDCSTLGIKPINLNLPAICSNQPYVQLRWITWFSAATSCIFTLDNINITSQGSLINIPRATNITHTSAFLGATISDDARIISDKGTVYATQSGVTASDNSLSQGSTSLGAYSHLRDGLQPQTRYFFKGYGISFSQSLLSDEGDFRTLSAPVSFANTNQVATTVSNSQINLSWASASFPTVGASASGYIILRAIFPAIPALINLNGAAALPDANTIVVNTLAANAVAQNVTGLNSFVRYNFKIIPFTWDGVNNTTRNYFTTNTTFDGTTLSGPVSIKTAPLVNITQSSVVSGGLDVNDGGGVVTSKGVVWGLSNNPTVSTNKLESGAGINSFSSVITNLISQTQYFVRAYAENNAGIGYGENFNFRTLSALPTTQASNFIASGNNVSALRVDLSWTSAVFPATGATGRGYAVLYAVAPNIPTLTNTNGQSISVGPNTLILSAQLASTSTNFTVATLSNSISYNFVIVPFTWDGTNTSTYNYLYATAPRVTSIKLPVIIAGATTSFCKGGAVVLNSNETTGNLWFRNGIAISGANSSTYSATETGLYTVRTGTSTSVGIQVAVFALPVPAISSTNGNKISKGFSTQLLANDGVTYQWSPNFRISDAKISNPTVQPDVTTIYTVTVTNASGCTSSESITIEVLEDFKISFQTLLTPNGDGKNDVWLVKNIESYPDNEVKVYDQAGREVFRKKRYDNSWNGTFNGSDLPKGTYPYLIYFGTGQNIIKGYLTILR